MLLVNCKIQHRKGAGDSVDLARPWAVMGKACVIAMQQVVRRRPSHGQATQPARIWATQA